MEIQHQDPSTVQESKFSIKFYLISLILLILVFATVASKYYVNDGLLYSCKEFANWEILDAKGIPNCGQR